MLSFFNKQMVGVDLGTSTIKIAVLSQQKDSYRLHACDFITIEQKLIDERGMISDPTKLAIYIRDILKKYQIRSGHIITAVPAQMTTKDTIHFTQNEDEAEQLYQIELEAMRMLPPSSVPSFDYRVVSGNQNKQTVEIFAIDKEVVDLQQETFNALKPARKLYVVDTTSFALLRSLHQAWGHEQAFDQIRVVLDLGNSHSQIYVMQDKNLIYQQNLVINGEQLTQQIMRYYNIDYSQAQDKKEQNSLPAGYKQEVLQPYIENATIDIVQAIQNFFSSSSFSRVDGIFVAGGHGLLDGFVPYIAQKTHTPTQYLNPFFGLTRSTQVNESHLRKKMPTFATAIGLALRGFAEVN